MLAVTSCLGKVVRHDLLRVRGVNNTLAILSGDYWEIWLCCTGFCYGGHSYLRASIVTNPVDIHTVVYPRRSLISLRYIFGASASSPTSEDHHPPYTKHHSHSQSYYVEEKLHITRHVRPGHGKVQADCTIFLGSRAQEWYRSRYPNLVSRPRVYSHPSTGDYKQPSRYGKKRDIISTTSENT